MVIVSFFIGIVIGFTMSAILNASSEANKKSEIEVSAYKNKNKVDRVLISKNINEKVKIGQEFVGKEAKVAKQVIDFFKGKYIEKNYNFEEWRNENNDNSKSKKRWNR